MKSKVIKYTAEFDEQRYWERVKGNLGWLGNTHEEAKERQKKISNVVIGIAGCGGIGGAVAERLVRLGVRHIKIADPDYFDLSNINRQYGASLAPSVKIKLKLLENLYLIFLEMLMLIFSLKASTIILLMNL